MKLLPLLALVLLAACAHDEAVYPSLAPRAVEKTGFAEPVPAPPAPVVADPALDQRLATLSGTLDGIVKGYDGDAARAKAAAGVAGTRTVGSEAWIAAQTALAALDDWRAQAAGVATDADALARERAETAGTAYPTLDALRERAAREADREAAGIAAVGALLPNP